MQSFKELGVVGVKLAYPHPRGPDVTHGQLLKDIQSIGLKIIITLAVDGEHADRYQALQV